MDKNDLTYFEDLESTGITCPHEDAFQANGDKTYFRVLKGVEITSESFLPTPVKNDRPLPPQCDACILKSVSIYDNLEGLINGYFRLPSNKGKKKRIGVLKLNPHDGMLKQTFGANHHSWWRSTAFDHTQVEIKEITI